MDPKTDPERAPLLGTSNTVTFGGYTYSPSDQEEQDREPYTNARESDRESTCRLSLPRTRDTDSDGEYLSSASRTSRTLPNNAPVPFVYLGYLCAILAGICFTSSNVMVKYLPDVNSWQLLFVRCVAQLATMIPIMYFGKHHILGTPDIGTRWRIAAQGVLGGLLLLAIFEAVGRMPLGDCTAIFFSSPAFTMILSLIILRDHCGLWRCIVCITLLGGVMILSRPPALFPQPNAANNSLNGSEHHDHHGLANKNANEGSYELVGILFAVAVPTLSAWIVIITRQAKHVHYSVLVFWFGIGGLVVSLIGIFAIDTEPMFSDWDIREWILSFMVALVGILGSILMTKAVCWVTPSKVMVVRSFEVVAAYILQVTVFDVPTHWTDLAGTICIIGAVIMMGVEDCLMEAVNWRFL
eukprot:GFUD01030538.1.p1 GENE.GFUD01030538.1~~GFUD01030538.1.p1  ORF type:complete len:411 (-),score=91.10 GFUD01030538.1:126-1358(-)